MVNRKYEEPEKFERKNVKRKRKPMTEEQKLAAAERLRKAREARGPSKNLSVHESIRDLEPEHFLNPNKVKEWVKVWNEKRLGIKMMKDSKDWRQRLEYQVTDNYIKNMQSYLSTGVWSDMYYGENRQHKIKYISVVPAYDANGNMKRSHGVWYSDIGVYGENNET